MMVLNGAISYFLFRYVPGPHTSDTQVQAVYYYDTC